MVSAAEHSKTEEDDDRVDERPPETVVSQPDSDEELAKLEDRWRRAVADLDNLERALSHGGDQSDAVVAGVRSILEQAMQVLEQLGYPRNAEAGVPFDP